MTLDPNITGPNTTNDPELRDFEDHRYNHGDDEVTMYERSEARRSTGTSEFWIYIFGVVTLLFFTYDDGRDSLTREDGWRYACFLTVAYLISRGLAKAGSSEPRIRHRSF